MTATIITAIFGGYDQPKRPIPQSIDCRYVIVTDDPDIKAPGYDAIHVPAVDVWFRADELVSA